MHRSRLAILFLVSKFRNGLCRASSFEARHGEEEEMSGSCKPILLAVLFLVVPANYAARSNSAPLSQQVRQQSDRADAGKAQPAKSIVYKNKRYRFRFSLPRSWKRYAIIVEQWHGSSDQKGPEILIRHPLWTAANPHQDIQVLVFTLAQWELIDQGEPVVSAAPVGPGELGRNAKYVLAVPPRYSAAGLLGCDDVIEIMQPNSLHPFWSCGLGRMGRASGSPSI
jgi:hypothetical protein